MQIASMYFKERAHAKLHDAQLQANLAKFQGRFVPARAHAITELDDFEATRDAAEAIRDRALEDLDVWLSIFEENARARGATVLYAQTPAEINALVLDIARRHGIAKIIKSKSMVSEESGLDHALESAGLTVVETDLGEYILQINNYEPPSHIIGPALHKSLDEVSALFERRHGTPRKQAIDQLCLEARSVLREHYLTADMGISGGNFFVAETGSVVLVTNEGNATLTTTLPKVHVAISGIEKLVPTLEDVATLMRLLPRSATGQSISNYVDILTGVKGDGEFHGAEHMYFIVVDSGRTDVLASEVRKALRCIRCGACMNHCPVYQNIGGHAYGWVYPGPIGIVLTPMYVGIENALDLPYASTMCNQCGVVCPVKIPLPDLQRKLREGEFARNLRPWYERLGLRAWGWLARKPMLYDAATRIGARLLRMLADRNGMIRTLPLGSGWTDERDMPAPAGRTFRELYKARKTSSSPQLSPRTRGEEAERERGE
ncbi:MAG TPA: LutB/LldF family L-lactate oxidation iron-sulfur protein [Casimicrobiaceae bacterium]|nr:LutB/LldF family L-lactate oxidation iron-sulfur protein [Casimicrobiaceae bacterium]